MDIQLEMAKWIKDQISEGHSLGDIEEHLLQQGYTDFEIKSALQVVQQDDSDTRQKINSIERSKTKLLVLGTSVFLFLIVIGIGYYSLQLRKVNEYDDNANVTEGVTEEISHEEIVVEKETSTSVSVQEKISTSSVQEQVTENALKINPVTAKGVVTTETPSISTQEPSSGEIEKQNVVVVGYEWISNPGSPKFSSTTIPLFWFQEDPDWQNKKYDVYIWENNEYVLYDSVKSMGSVSFPSGGISRFKVIGIDPEYKICPDARGYVFAMYFTESGVFNGSRVPITAPSPNNVPCKVRY